MTGEEFLINPQLGSVRAYPGQCRLHRLLHYLAKLSGHGEATLALHLVGFDEKNVPAGRCPCQANRDTGALRALSDFTLSANLDTAEHIGLLHEIGRNYQLVGLALRNPSRLFAADGSNRPLQVAHTCLACVVPDDEPNRLLRKFNLLLSDSVFLNLPWDQVLKCDV